MVIQVGREADAGRRIRQRQGTRIREARTKIKGWTRRELADALGVTERSIHLWETGEFSPRQAMQIRIAKELGVPWTFLFSIDGEAA